MKKSLLISAFLSIVLGVNLTILIPQARSTLCVGGGSLAITALPSGQSYGTRTINSTPQTLSYSYTASFQFEDMRGTLAGFNVAITATDFSDPATAYKIDVTNFKIASDNNDTLGFIDCDDTTGITVDQINLSAFVDSDDNGTSDSKILFSGDVRTRIGKYLFEPEIELTIPPHTPSGTYSTTLTVSIY